MNDEELEQAFRDGLERRAARTDVGVPVVDRARADAAHSRRRPWVVAAGMAAAAVIVAGVITLVIERDDASSPSDRADDPAETTAADGPWRTERWGDLQVDVPASWGYGGAPDAEGTACFPEAMVLPSGEPVGESNEPPLGYVGRPITLTDVCMARSTWPWETRSPYVWLGAGVAPGIVELPGGYTQETVEVQGTTLTVATRDPALRARILDTAAGNEMCLSELDRNGPIEHDLADDPQAEPVTLRVCAYRLDNLGSGIWRLTYAADLGRGPLRDYLAAVERGDPPRDQCPTIDYQLFEAVVLELLDADGRVLRQDAVNTMPSCAGIAVDATSPWELKTTRLTLDMVRPWAVGGVRAVVHGSGEDGLIGMMG